MGTVSTCTMAPSTHPLHTNVEKGEASSTTCSPKPDSVLSEVSSTTALVPPQETDSDPNVTSTTGIESKKKLDINRDIKTIKKEFDSLTSFKEKKDLVEESLFTPTATIIQAVKPKYDKKDKRTSSSSRLDIFNTIKDVKRAKDNLHKEKIKSNKEKKDKMKVKQKEDLKDFLQATATIRKEAKKEQDKKPEAAKDEKSENKRRLSINSEVDDSEPEIKKVKTDAMKPMGRIPKLEKKEEKRERTDSVKSLDGNKEKHKSLSKSDSRSKSKHDDRHRHRSNEKHEERNREKHKKKKKEKDKEKDKEDKSKKIESKSRSHSTDEDKHHKKMKKSKDFKKRDEKKSKSERKERNRDRDKDKEKDKYRDKEKHRDKDKERERKR